MNRKRIPECQGREEAGGRGATAGPRWWSRKKRQRTLARTTQQYNSTTSRRDHPPLDSCLCSISCCVLPYSALLAASLNLGRTLESPGKLFKVTDDSISPTEILVHSIWVGLGHEYIS